jgi:hypothetical protein
VYGFCIAENLIEERSFLTTVTEVALFQVNFINGTAVSYLANQHNKLNKKTTSPPKKTLREQKIKRSKNLSWSEEIT